MATSGNSWPRSPGQGLVNEIPRRVQVTDADQDGAEALICRPSVEFREVQWWGSQRLRAEAPVPWPWPLGGR